MTFRIYNTLTKQEEEFRPLKDVVTFYSCGPTVYDYAHIGNFRSFLNADVLRRALELFGYRVRHVMNITDVGHMTDDANADGGGEDKMQVAARRLLEAKKSGKLPPGVDLDADDPYAIANFYADAFLEDARTLGMRIAHEVKSRPELMPRPTRFIEPMIEMVIKLIDRGHAYVANDGVVYFDVQSFSNYGQLSGNTPDSIRAGEGGRVDEANQAMKKHPADFMLWKPDPHHVMKWPSPWGDGYPGWHLECSVMAQSLLGDVVDLHSGGEDNIFPHHECEIAQSCSATGAKTFSRYWFHTRHLIVEGEKMSKSKGNFFTVRDLLAKGASPAAIRLEIISSKYREQSNFTFQGLVDSQRDIDRWLRLKGFLQDAIRTNPSMADGPSGPLAEALGEFKSALASDLNIAGAIGVLNKAVGQYHLSQEPPDVNVQAELDALSQMNSVLGVLDLKTQGEAAIDSELARKVESLIVDRNAARKNKDFKHADQIRDELLAMAIEIKDGPQGTTWTRIVK